MGTVACPGCGMPLTLIRRTNRAECRTRQCPFATVGRNKYGAIRTTIGGETFDSKAEARRWCELLLMQSQGVISCLMRQVKYPLEVYGVMVGHYICDFAYLDANHLEVVEDVKSEPTKTSTYRLKKKLMRACYGIEIREVQ